MIDPTNMMLHLKEVVFVGLLVFAALAGRIKIYKEQGLYFISFLFLAFLSISMGILFWGADLQGTVSYLKSISFITIAFVLSKQSVEELLRMMFYVGFGLSLFIVLLYISYLTHVVNLDKLIDIAVNANYTIMIAIRKFLGLDMIMFFYKSMPFCFFAFIYALRNNFVIPIVIIALSIIIGGSRTPILMGMILVIYILASKSKRGLKIIITLILSCILILITISLLSEDNRDGGDDIKFTTAQELMRQSSFLGHGVGATYYSSERGIVSNSEMTYIEMLYQYGYLLFPFVIILFFSPFVIIYNITTDVLRRDFSIAYLAYLINAGTNPLLISSTGIFVFACSITIMAKVKEEKKRKKKLQIANNPENDSNPIGNI